MKKQQWYFIFILSLFASSLLYASSGTIKSGDIISIWVKGESDLTVNRQVDANGSIDYPLLGSIGVKGLETSDAASLVKQMLQDGYLRNPQVKVVIKKRGNISASSSSRNSTSTEPLGSKNQQSVTTSEPVLIKVVDAQSGKGIDQAALLLANRVYQSNKLGQILVDSTSGRFVLIADGYEIMNSNMAKELKSGKPQRIELAKIPLADQIMFRVLDAFTRKPLNGVSVSLDNMKVKTNRNGIFKIRKLKREFGEVKLNKRGYKSHRLVVDFKGPKEQLILMVRDE
ncbi:MAG: polysaccharide biosynthesis/export family protein [Candidatus Rifleibacteriota bacterium]